MSCISFLNTCPSSGDSEQQLLSKILQVLNTTGGGIAGVSSLSVNGGAPQTGAVSITTGGTVTSVNGDAGPAVSLDSGEIPEGANLYFTESRVRATVLTGFASALGAITAADSVLSAFGKTQGRLAALEAGTAGPFLLKAGDTGTGAFVFTPSVDNVVPLTLTTTAGSAATASNFVVNHGATNRLTLRNDGRFILSGRILATNTDVLGHALNFSDAGTNNAPLALALAHTSTAGLGTAAAGFGAMLDWNLDSTTTLATRAVRETAAWTVATHATRTASLTFFAFTGGSETTQLTLTNNQVQGGDGTVALPTFTTRNDPDTGVFFSAANTLAIATDGASRVIVDSIGRVGIGLAPVEKLSVLGAISAYDTGVATTAANYSRTVITPQVGNHLIRTEAAGTGTLRTLQVGTGPATGTNIAGVSTIIHGGQPTGNAVPGAILFQQGLPVGGSGASVTALATIWQISTGGHLLAGTDNTYDIGAVGATRPKNVYIAGTLSVATVAATSNITVGGAQFFGWSARSLMWSPADSQIRLTNAAGTDFDRLQFGGTTSAFPALKRSAAQLHCRLADDSADAVFQALQFNVAGTKVVGAQGAAVADASGGTTIDAEARTALNALLARLRTHGLIAT